MSKALGQGGSPLDKTFKVFKADLFDMKKMDTRALSVS